MGAVQNLLERLGFVRLRDYGLHLTPDRRIVSNRAVLDDGYGTRIVGYTDDDLAAMELVPWGSPPAPKPVVKALPAPPPAPPEEEDWEWQIARARATAEDVDERAATAKLPVAEPATTVRSMPVRSLPQLPRVDSYR